MAAYCCERTVSVTSWLMAGMDVSHRAGREKGAQAAGAVGGKGIQGHDVDFFTPLLQHAAELGIGRGEGEGQQGDLVLLRERFEQVIDAQLGAVVWGVGKPGG